MYWEFISFIVCCLTYVSVFVRSSTAVFFFWGGGAKKKILEILDSLFSFCVSCWQTSHVI